MKHLDDEQLAALALGDARPTEQDDHLDDCPLCVGRLDELRRIVVTGRAGAPYPMVEPSPSVWAAIQAELAAGSTEATPGLTRTADRPVKLELAGDPTAPNRQAERPPAQPVRALTTRRRTRWIAAAVALVVAAAGVVVYRAVTDGSVVATATLNPLTAAPAQGRAELVRRDGTQELSIDVTLPAVSNEFQELWLINTDGRRMISLGIVPPNGRASYPVPDDNAALNGYTIVDISLEPFDGDAAHSHNSILRGNLT